MHECFLLPRSCRSPCLQQARRWILLRLLLLRDQLRIAPRRISRWSSTISCNLLLLFRPCSPRLELTGTRLLQHSLVRLSDSYLLCSAMLLQIQRGQELIPADTCSLQGELSLQSQMRTQSDLKSILRQSDLLFRHKFLFSIRCKLLQWKRLCPWPLLLAESAEDEEIVNIYFVFCPVCCNLSSVRKSKTCSLGEHQGLRKLSCSFSHQNLLSIGTLGVFHWTLYLLALLSWFYLSCLDIRRGLLGYACST